jgi:hypothetical protein
MNDVMTDLASDALNSMTVFFLPHIAGDAGEFGQSDSSASNVVGLTPWGVSPTTLPPWRGGGDFENCDKLQTHIF